MSRIQEEFEREYPNRHDGADRVNGKIEEVENLNYMIEEEDINKLRNEKARLEKILKGELVAKR